MDFLNSKFYLIKISIYLMFGILCWSLFIGNQKKVFKAVKTSNEETNIFKLILGLLFFLGGMRKKLFWAEYLV